MCTSQGIIQIRNGQECQDMILLYGNKMKYCNITIYIKILIRLEIVKTMKLYISWIININVHVDQK